MGKRSRITEKNLNDKASHEISSPDHTEHGVVNGSLDEDVVAYASEGSEVADLAQSEDGNDSSEDDDDMVLTPGKVLDQDDASDVDVTFEFYDPNSSDANQISNLLFNFARETDIAVGDLAKEILAQFTVGTCVKVTDEAALVAFISCLNLARHANLLKGLFDRLLTASGDSSAKSGFENLIGMIVKGDCAEEVGLVLTERVLNLPSVLVAKMQEALFCEIEWATEDEKKEEDRKSFMFERYLYVTEVFCRFSTNSKRCESKRARSEAGTNREVVFIRPEDEAWMEVAEMSVFWNLDGEQVGAEGLQRMRMAMIVSAASVPKLRARTCEIVGLEDQKTSENDGNALKRGN